MLPTILTIVDQPAPAEARESCVSADVSLSQFVRASTFCGGSMSFTSACLAPDFGFDNGAPTYKGNRIFRCFKNRGNGLLFRIVNDEERKWAFYNDMRDYNMVVKCTFDANTHVTPIGNTIMDINPETGDRVLQVKIGPRETEMFLDGAPRGFRIGCEARPIPRSECLAKHIKMSDAQTTSVTLQGVSDEDSQLPDSTTRQERRVSRAAAKV